MLRKLCTRLSEKPELGDYIRTIQVEQSIEYHDGYPQYRTLEEDVAYCGMILRLSQPKCLQLHLFETSLDILESVQTVRLQHLKLCVRSDVPDLPDDPNFQGALDPNPWLDLIHRSSETLLTLEIGGRLTGADLDIDDIHFEIPRCRQLRSLRDLLYCEGHQAEEDTRTPGELYPLLALANAESLETLDLLPLEEAAGDFLGWAVLPKLKAIQVPLDTENIIALQAVLECLRAYSTLETMEVSVPLLASAANAYLYLARALIEGYYPNLKVIDMSSRPLEHGRSFELCKIELAEICQKRSIQLLLDEARPAK